MYKTLLFLLLLLLLTNSLTNAGHSCISSATKFELLDFATLAPPFWIYANNVNFPRFLWRGREKNFGGTTTKFIFYVKKGLHAKIGACIRPVTINTLSDLAITALDKRTVQLYVLYSEKLINQPTVAPLKSLQFSSKMVTIFCWMLYVISC